MSTRVERLRIYLLSSAIFLLLVIGAFIAVARYLRRHAIASFPLQLAKDILRETQNPTFCQSDGRSTRFCIHASKSIEYNNGRITLHNASITLYGAKGDRSDQIYGDEFEYDKNDEVVRANGVVHIDLLAAGRPGGPPAAAAKVMHATTSGLVYLQKLGVASTSAPVEFEAGGLTGHAVGADYSSDSAVATLHSAVTMSGVVDGQSVAMTAATAAFDDRSQQALLTHATYESQGRKAAADQATLYRRADGTLSRIDARGNVTLGANGATVTSARADVTLTAASRAQTAVLSGGVKYASSDPMRMIAGQADGGTIDFDAEPSPQPQHAVFSGGVQLAVRTRASASAPWQTRELRSPRVEMSLARVEDKAELRDVTADGGARVTATDATAKGPVTSSISADMLTAHLGDPAKGRKTPQLETLVGRGNTRLYQVSADGREQTVSADTLDAKMRPAGMAPAGSKPGSASAKGVADSLWSAVQTGHVQMTQRTPAQAATVAGVKGRPEEIVHALGDRAAYDGDADRMTLSGGIQLSDAASMLWADQVTFDRQTGDAHASGGVKVSYTQRPAAGDPHPSIEPAHVLADRADLENATGRTTFYGKPVRMWQGGSQLLAPEIELRQKEQTLVARSGAGSPPGALVHTVLEGTGGASPRTGAKAGAAQAGCPADAGTREGAAAIAAVSGSSAGAIQVASGGMTYSGVTGQAEFTGGFRADTADGTVRAAEGTVYLRQASRPNEASGSPSAETSQSSPMDSLSGEIDRMVATGRVEFDKPGLKATGEQLVYTASDRTAVLTGDAKTPPKAVGEQGTTTGSALRLHSSCNGGGGSVEVVGAPGVRTHTTGRAGEQGTGEKGKR